MARLPFGLDPPASHRRALFGLAVAALVVRAVTRLTAGSADFWANGYIFYFDFARGIAGGQGLAFDGVPTAYRVPLYPMLLALVTGGHRVALPIILTQAAIGAGTVLAVGALASRLFGPPAAIPAATLAAFYPYYVVHDTAMQETSLFTLLTVIGVLACVAARRTLAPRASVFAGVWLGLDVLTRATIAPFAVVPPIWLLATGAGPLRARATSALLYVAALALTLSPWLLRSHALTGAFTLGTETGEQLWVGNNPYTFSRYPAGSIDDSAREAAARFTPEEQASQTAASDTEMGADRWYERRAIDYMRADPLRTAINGLRKVAATFSWLPSPRRSFWPTVAYTVSYGAVCTLGLFGMVLAVQRGPDHLLILALFLSFIAVTFVFFGHTSHRAYLDVYWMAYAGWVLSGRWDRGRSGGMA